MNEKEINLLSIREKPPIEQVDTAIYEKLQQFAETRLLTSLEGDAADIQRQRQLFENGEVHNPELKYPNINVPLLEEKEQGLLTLKDELAADTTLDPAINQLYQLKISEKLAAIWLLLATAVNDQGKFAHYSEYLYGRPDPDIWLGTIHEVKELVAKGLASEDGVTVAAAEDFLAHFPLEDLQSQPTRMPSLEFMEDARQTTLSDIGHLIPDLDDSHEYPPDEIATVFREVLDKIGGADWEVSIDPGKVSIMVNSVDKVVKVPQNRPPATAQKLSGLVAHEIGTHALRAINGAQSNLRILETGFDRYSTSEEGVAKLRDSLIEGKELKVLPGLDSHFSISIAQGMDGTPRDFRDVYAVMLPYYRLDSLLEGLDPERVEERARHLAWTRTYRTFRGTTGNEKGHCFTKDLAYREGSIRLWHVLEEQPELLSILSVGKFDPTNSEHIALLRQLEIV